MPSATRTIIIAGLAGCGGALLGAVTSYQFFDIKLTEGSGEMLGAALGAFLAVFLASWLAHRREDREKEMLAAVICEIWQELMVSTHDLIEELDEVEKDGTKFRTAVFMHRSDQMLEAYQQVQREVERLTSGLMGNSIELAWLDLVCRRQLQAAEAVQKAVAFYARNVADTDGVRAKQIRATVINWRQSMEPLLNGRF